MDFNIKTAQPTPKSHKFIAPNVKQPEFTEEYYRAIIEQTGDKLRVY
jgi:hypothetical protein